MRKKVFAFALMTFRHRFQSNLNLSIPSFGELIHELTLGMELVQNLV